MSTIPTLLAAVILFATRAHLGATQDPRGVTVEPRKMEQPQRDLGRRATLTRPAKPSPARPALHPPCPVQDTVWMLIDSLKAELIIPAGERYAAVFDFQTRSLRDTLLPDPLTPLARQAIEIAPNWLKSDLADNLRRIDRPDQDLYANLILLCPDKRYYDEVCFQVAHLSPQTLTYYEFNRELLVENVQLAYEIDPELQYVDILDYGDPVLGGDYYSTTRYWTVEGGDTQLVEIPKEMYYWWVISPKLSDELPRMDWSVYGYFWREYLYHFCDSGYPLLREELAPTRVLWDGNLHNLPAGRPFQDTTFALDVIANWTTYTVPYPASGNRPIQPNVIAHEHNGNCGELQDLLSAALRTGLIPAVCTSDINEDHVWVEFWWGGDWHPYQVDLGFGSTHIDDPGVAYDREHGGSKEVSAIWNWRGDGYQWSDVARYSDCCTLTLSVRDRDGEPVDGAIMKLSSEMWPELGEAVSPCFYGVTDGQGEFTTTLGDSQNYYLGIESALGNYSAGLIIDSALASPGVHLYFDHNLPGQMYHVPAIPDTDPPPPEDWFKVEVRYSTLKEAVYGYDCYNSYSDNWYTRTHYPGSVDFFIADQREFQRYLSGSPFFAYEIREDLAGDSVSFILRTNENYYIVLSGEEQLSLTEIVQIDVFLYENQLYTGVAKSGAPFSGVHPILRVDPNPFSRTTTIRYQVSADGRPRTAVCLAVYDLSGSLVRTLLGKLPNHPTMQLSGRVVWDGRDDLGRPAASGVYLLSADLSAPGPERRFTTKLVLIR